MAHGTLNPPQNIQIWLYGGIALVIISMFFIGRDVQSSTFLTQALVTLAPPLFFYIIGGLVHRYLQAPLAAPGLVATGAWLVAVGCFHLYIQRDLLPLRLQDYFLPVAMTITAGVITLTGHRINSRLLVILVPITQIIALWSLLDVSAIAVAWWPPISFIVVFVWWEYRNLTANVFWHGVYRASAAILMIVLFLCSYLLASSTPQTIYATWIAGAVTVTSLGLRNGWLHFAPLSIVMLFCASIWGLAPEFWPLAWLTLAVLTVFFIERQRAHRSKNIILAEASVALAVLLSGGAAVFSGLGTRLGWADIHPLLVAVLLLAAGLLLGWLGLRRQLSIAVHVALWLIASAWAQVYLVVFNDPNVYGLWLGLPATLALFAERVMTSLSKQKRKNTSLPEAVARWPLADLALGLTLLIVLWMFTNIGQTVPFTLAVTMLVVVGIWVSAGLLYRLPILLHIALWIAPLPYALLVMQFLPGTRSLPMMGFLWQLLGLGFVVLGHSLQRHRPTVVLPFFVAGYGLMTLSFLLTGTVESLFYVGLALVTLTSLLTSIAAAFDYHPAWTWLVGRMIDEEKRPLAFLYLHNFFLLIGAWMAAVWLQLMLTLTGLPMSQQGVVMVALSGVWIVLGRMLPRIPGMAGWSVYSAGWFMWVLGLLQVFHAPTEALITVILGLAISLEAISRTRMVYWLPVFIVQILFTLLQLTRLLDLPGQILMLLAMVIITVGGIYMHDQKYKGGGIVIASGGLFALILWYINPDIPATVLLSAPMVLIMVNYRHQVALWGLYGIWIVTLLHSQLFSIPYLLPILGVVQYLAGAAIARQTKQQGHTTFKQLMHTFDWHTPLLWGGLIALFLSLGNLVLVSAGELLYNSMSYAQDSATQIPTNTLLSHYMLVQLAVGGILLIGAAIMNMRQAPYFPLLLFLGAFLVPSFNSMQSYTTGLALLTIALRVFYIYAVSVPRPFNGARWLVWWVRPLVKASQLITAVSFTLILIHESMTSHSEMLLFLLNCVLVSVIAVQLFLAKPTINKLWVVIGLVTLSWGVFTEGLLGWGNLYFFALPVGALMLWLGWLFPDNRSLELGGIVVIIGTGLLGLDSYGLQPLTMLILAVQIILVGMYGYVAGRRLPFGVALGLIAAGLALRILMMNVWLIPLGIGAVLIIGAILLETNRALVERVFNAWSVRWQLWR